MDPIIRSQKITPCIYNLTSKTKAMKKIVYSIMGFLLLVFAGSHFYSCADYINVDEYFYDQLSLDSAFSKRQYVDGWLSNLYEHVGSDVGEMENDFKYASDDLIKRHDRIKALQNCNYSASNNEGQDKLGRLYETIRKASTFIINVDNCRDMTLSEISDYKAQARFARPPYTNRRIERKPFL